MSDKIVKFHPKNAAKDPDYVLEQAIGQYKNMLIIGWDKNDMLDVRSDTELKTSDILYLIEKFKHKLIRGDYAGE